MRESLKGKEVVITQKAKENIKQGQLEQNVALVSEKTIAVQDKQQAKEIAEKQLPKKSYEAFMSRYKERMNWITQHNPALAGILHYMFQSFYVSKVFFPSSRLLTSRSSSHTGFQSFYVSKVFFR